mgnify:CR=1 FL=1
MVAKLKTMIDYKEREIAKPNANEVTFVDTKGKTHRLKMGTFTIENYEQPQYSKFLRVQLKNGRGEFPIWGNPLKIEIEIFLEEQAGKIAPEPEPIAELQKAALTVEVQIASITWFGESFVANLKEGNRLLGQITFISAWGDRWHFRFGAKAGKSSSAYQAICSLMELAGALPF